MLTFRSMNILPCFISELLELRKMFGLFWEETDSSEVPCLFLSQRASLQKTKKESVG